MNRIFFDSLALLLEHAKQMGGWCAVCDDGTFQWFAPGKWTLTPAMLAIKGGTIGSWRFVEDTCS